MDVVVPKGVELSDLDMEMKVDEKEKDTAVLTYTYERKFCGLGQSESKRKYKKSIARILKAGRKPLIMRRISPARRASDKCWSTCLS